MKYAISMLFIFIGLNLSGQGLHPMNLTCESLVNPPVIDVTNPHLSWINDDPSHARNQAQTAYQVRVASSKILLMNDNEDLWNSGKRSSGQSVNIVYAGKKLSSRQECCWQVRVWDSNGKASEWSETATWTMGLLDQSEWKASWIGAPWQGEDPIPDNKRPLTASRAKAGEKPTSIEDLPSLAAPLLRKSFTINKKIISAKAFVTGLGYFEFYLNGKKVGNDVLVPNQTNYGKRPGLMNNVIAIPDNFREYKVFYLAYDLSEYIREGENAAGAIVGNGFYNAPINWTESYGTPRFIAQIYIRYADGTEQVIVTDDTWKAAKSAILMDLIFDGEHYDARREQDGWSLPGFDDSNWEKAAIRKAPEGMMRAHMSATDKVMESIKPVKIEKLGQGHFRVDFGQEISGWAHLAGITGKAGDRINIKYVHQTPSGDNSYTLKGKGNEDYHARFTWFVFREAEITGWPGTLDPENITAEAVYTDVKTTGKFECSNEMFNRINKIWWRSQTDNMHGGIASDCPNRERSPYTGDGQVSCVTVMHNFDASSFYRKWIRDILGAQNPETGYVPNGAPWQPGCGGGVAWGAAMNIMPWEFFLHYGDTSMLAENYEGMKGYIRYMLTWTNEAGIMFSQAKGRDGRLNKWMNLGDWVAPGELPPDEMVHTFYLWRCADLTSKAAKVLGKNSESIEYEKIAERTRSAFQKKYYDSNKGTYGKAGGNIFALKMGVPEDQKQKVIASLKSDIEADGGHLDTGIFGTQFFFEVLAENGLQELAYSVMNMKTMPSYGWWLTQGVTTSWEKWDAPGSGNHPMFGGGIVWFYRKLSGMNADPGDPGYKNIIFRPQPAGDLTMCSYSNLTPYGTAGIKWNREGKQFKIEVTIPAGSKADVYVPTESSNKVREGGQRINKNPGIIYSGSEEGFAHYKVRSGVYTFTSELR